MNEPVSVVLFDAVGTLIRPHPPVLDVYAAAGGRFGSRHDAHALRPRFQQAFFRHNQPTATNEELERERWRRVVAEVFDDVAEPTESLFLELWHHFADAAHWELFEDVVPIWQWLRQQRIPIGIASNFDVRLTDICRVMEPLHDADFLFCSSELGFPKPCPEFYAAVQRQLEQPPRKILMVGDSFTNDVEAARAVGWRACWLQREERPEDAAAITTLADVRKFV